MTTTDRPWQWQAGTLYRWGPRRWAVDAVGNTLAGLAMGILPGIFAFLGVRTLAESSWSWSASMCFVRFGNTRCIDAWILLLIAAVLLLVWSASWIHLAWSSRWMRKTPTVLLHLDARELHGTIPAVWRRPSPMSVRWEDIVAIEAPRRGGRTLRLRLGPAATITPRNGLWPQQPVAPAAPVLSIECADSESDVTVLRHFLDAGARRSLTTEASAQEAARLARV